MTVFRFYAGDDNLQLQVRDDGTWAVVKGVGVSGYDVLTTTVFDYAREAFNKEIERLELAFKEGYDRR